MLLFNFLLRYFFLFVHPFIVHPKKRVSIPVRHIYTNNGKNAIPPKMMRGSAVGWFLFYPWLWLLLQHCWFPLFLFFHFFRPNYFALIILICCSSTIQKWIVSRMRLVTLLLFRCAVIDTNDIPYCISLSYWQKRLSTTLQKLNAIVLKATQSKISQKLGLQRDIAFDLNDIIIDNGHLHQWM